MSYIGNTKIGKMFLGDTEIAKAYLGTDLVFQKGESPTPAVPIMVDYIETDGTAYIDTGIKGNTPLSILAKITPVRETNTVSYIGANVSSSSRFRMLQWGSSISGNYKNYFSMAYNASLFQGVDRSNYIDGNTPFYFLYRATSGNQQINVKENPSGNYYNASGQAIGEVATEINLYLFAQNNNGTPDQNASLGTKFHYFKIYRDINTSDLVFDGIPCFYNGKYGLWDNVSNTFFGNAASNGAFRGPSIQ